MTRHNHRESEAGFLLAEMLTTLTISAFVLMGLTALGAMLVRAVDRSVAAVATVDDLGRTLASLDGLIGSAVRARFDGAESQPFLFNGDDRRLLIAHRDQTPGALPVTRVMALRSDNGRLLRAEATLPARVAALADLQFGPPQVVYAGGARIRFSYAGSSQSGEVALWPVGGAMPAAIVVEARDSATGRVLARSRTTLAANADVGCLVDGACGRADRPVLPGAHRHPQASPDDPTLVAGAVP